jgi:hypothetical protein
MATLKQYEFFKSLYDEESDRTKQLRDLGKTYLSLATFYSAFVAFVFDKLKPETIVAKGIFMATIICMMAAFLLSIWGAMVSNFEALSDPNEVIEQFTEDVPMADEEFFDHRIADYTVAYERNSAVNDAKALHLTIAGFAVVLGIFLHACYLVLRVA